MPCHVVNSVFHRNIHLDERLIGTPIFRCRHRGKTCFAVKHQPFFGIKSEELVLHKRNWNTRLYWTCYSYTGKNSCVVLCKPNKLYTVGNLMSMFFSRHLNNMPVGSLMSWSYTKFIKFKKYTDFFLQEEISVSKQWAFNERISGLIFNKWETIMHFARWILLLKMTLALPEFLKYVDFQSPEKVRFPRTCFTTHMVQSKELSSHLK